MGSKQLGSKFLQRSQICSHTPSALNAGAKRSGATCHMAMPQCCYLANGAKRPGHTTNTIKLDRIPFDPCNSIKRFDLSFRPEKFDLFTATQWNSAKRAYTRVQSEYERTGFRVNILLQKNLSCFENTYSSRTYFGTFLIDRTIIC